jgi:hypothetical protein
LFSHATNTLTEKNKALIKPYLIKLLGAYFNQVNAIRRLNKRLKTFIRLGAQDWLNREVINVVVALVKSFLPQWFELGFLFFNNQLFKCDVVKP